MSTRYGMLNRITTRPGQRDAVVQILLSGARMQGAMKGCELYVVHTSPTDGNQIWVTEVWRTKGGSRSVAEERRRTRADREGQADDRVDRADDHGPRRRKGLPA